MNFNDSRVLITGGAGFIGSNLAKALLKEGAKITIFDDFSAGLIWFIHWYNTSYLQEQEDV